MHSVITASVVAALLLVAGASARVRAASPRTQAAPATAPSSEVRKAGNFAVELRPPAGGVYAEEETEVEFRVADATLGDIHSSVAGVPRARVRAKITLTSDPSVSVSEPSVRSASVPGDYALSATFPQAGAYAVELNVTPPGDGAKEFTVTLPLTVKEKTDPKKREAAALPYKLKLEMEPRRPAAGDAVVMTLSIVDRASGAPIEGYGVVYDSLLRVAIARDDLGAFFYEQPKLDEKTGKFTLGFAFPNGGDWRVFAEAAPIGAGGVVVSEKVTVEGARALREPLMPRGLPLVRSGMHVLTMKPLKASARRTLPLTFSLADNQGRPVVDIQPWAGALAHLILIERDGQTYVHSVTDESDPRTGRTGDLVFPTRFPKSGVYKGWVQFMRLGQTHTLPFLLRVSD